MINRHILRIVARFKRIVRQPRDELNRWQRAVRFTYDLMRFGGEQLQHDRAVQMAAALAFRSLFALLPVLIVTTIVVKAARGTDAFMALARDMLNEAGLDQIRLIPASNELTGPAETTVSLAQWLEGLLGQAAAVNLAAVGWIGLAVIIYAAIGLMVTIENSFNTVFRAPEGRAWSRRLPLYWFVLTLGPVMLGIVWYLNRYFADKLSGVTSWQPLIDLAAVGWSILLVWLFVSAVYLLIPNTTVAVRPALLGAFVTALLLETGKHFLGVYLQNAFSISHLYGSLGLIPVFMFWVYLMWLVVLFGLELSATLQRLQGRDLDDMRRREHGHTGIYDSLSVVSIVDFVAERFSAGRPASARQIADATSIPESIVSTVLPRLVEAGVLHRLEHTDAVYALACPAEAISVERIVEIGHDLVAVPQSRLVEQLRAAERHAASGLTLTATPQT